ncbi:MAG: S9 family peptidase [Candidatus Marinimicrobia bacterium]|nr:S9 family peptidase [Candidatus Neomarinimicrobiota bacterium]MCF7827746.1 S9 family peptidase [Candidatus Neomarinimicrobiota bacterium]MCF7881454.1 S9 family peptidase [Candidatus Neomarinimicrobiota bacterium]
MQKRFLSFFLLIIFALPLSGQQRAFTLDDYYRVKSVGGPQVAPDGEILAFTMTVYDLPQSEKETQIWLVNADGSNPRQLTDIEENASRPRWHPDGDELLFVSKDTVTEKSQAFSITIDSKEVKQLTSFSMGVDNPRWSPDGQYLVFSSRVFPEAGADSEQNKALQEDTDAGPVKAHYADNLLYRHWTYFKDGKRRHLFSKDLTSGELVDLTPGDRESPRFDLGGGPGFDISPDSKEVVFVSNPDSVPAASTNGDLWTVPIAGGKLTNLTKDNPAFDGHPRYSPDGKYIGYTMQRQPGYESDLMRLALYNRKTGERRVLTENFRNNISDFQWTPDSKTIYFDSPFQGYYPLRQLSIHSGDIEMVVPEVYTRGFDMGPDGKTIFFGHTAVDMPTEIFSVRSDESRQTQLTHFNKDLLKEVDFRPVESTWVESTDGKKIQVFIVKPHNFDPDKNYPLILNVHGGPQGMFGNSFRGDYQMYPGAGYVLAFSNPRGSTGYGHEFTAQISGDWGGQVFEDLMAVSDYLESLPYVDADRMGAMGWSYGGYMMNWFEGHTDRFKALVSMMGVYDLRSFYGATEELWFPEWDLGGQPWNSGQYEKWSPSSYVENFSTPCLVITGKKDFRVPYTQSLQLFTDLRKMGVKSELIVFENDGHWPDRLKSMPFYYNAHLYWFHKYLGGDPAPYDMTDMWRNQILQWGAEDSSDE